MNKYQEAISNYFTAKLNFDNEMYKTMDLLEELADKATPMKPKMVKLFGDDVPTCPAKKCGVGLMEQETIWHKSTYCGNCGQKLDWSKDE